MLRSLSSDSFVDAVGTGGNLSTLSKGGMANLRDGLMTATAGAVDAAGFAGDRGGRGNNSLLDPFFWERWMAACSSPSESPKRVTPDKL